jgi:hypothetical protein
MRTRTILAAAALLAVGTVLGGTAASARMAWPLAIAQQKAPREDSAEKQPADGKKPNIVFILMDNLGYGEPGCYGGGILRGAPTPRIDKLATEGTRLLNFNVEAECTPSRSAIMTGLRHSWSAGPAMKIVAEFEQSLKKYPPIAPGTPDPYVPQK